MAATHPDVRHSSTTASSVKIPLALVPIPEAWRGVEARKRMEISSKRAASKRLTLKFRDGRRCFYCSRRLRSYRPATLDHLIPYAVLRGWSNRNLVLACEPCNQAKADLIPAVLMPLLSTLVYRLATLNAARVERSLIPVGGA